MYSRLNSLKNEKYQENLILETSFLKKHYSDVIMGAIASQITILTIIYLILFSGADQRKHQSSASLAFVRGIHRWPVNAPHKWPVTRKMFPSDDVIMYYKSLLYNSYPQSTSHRNPNIMLSVCLMQSCSAQFDMYLDSKLSIIDFQNILISPFCQIYLNDKWISHCYHA